MSREETWHRLAPSIQELFIALYGSQDNFVNTNVISPLEAYIVEYNNIMGSDGPIRQLAFRIGLEIPRWEDADIYFYVVMQRLINLFGLTEIDKLKRVINITQGEYSAQMKANGEVVYTYPSRGEGPIFEEGEEMTTSTYHQRLLLYLENREVGE